jgi:nitrile hydratase
MSTTPERRGMHDMGGDPDHLWSGPVPCTEHVLAPWKKEVDAIRTLFVQKGLMTADELLLGIESLSGEDHARLTCDERWLASIVAIMEDAGVLAPGELARQIDRMDGMTPSMGAAVVACAWVDPAFKARLLATPAAACAELGIPPDWQEPCACRSRAVVEPRSVLAEFGVTVPETMEVRVHDSTADLRYLVLPARPAGMEGCSEAALAAIVTRDCMIGTAIPAA